MYSQNMADRRDEWVGKNKQEVEEHQTYLDRTVATENLKLERQKSQTMKYEPNPPPPYQACPPPLQPPQPPQQQREQEQQQQQMPTDSFNPPWQSLQPA
ncbi:unnamed protein product [Sphagnum balticum]